MAPHWAACVVRDGTLHICIPRKIDRFAVRSLETKSAYLVSRFYLWFGIGGQSVGYWLKSWSLVNAPPRLQIMARELTRNTICSKNPHHTVQESTPKFIPQKTKCVVGPADQLFRTIMALVILHQNHQAVSDCGTQCQILKHIIPMTPCTLNLHHTKPIGSSAPARWSRTKKILSNLPYFVVWPTPMM